MPAAVSMRRSNFQVVPDRPLRFVEDRLQRRQRQPEDIDQVRSPPGRQLDQADLRGEWVKARALGVASEGRCSDDLRQRLLQRCGGRHEDRLRVEGLRTGLDPHRRLAAPVPTADRLRITPLRVGAIEQRQWCKVPGSDPPVGSAPDETGRPSCPGTRPPAATVCALRLPCRSHSLRLLDQVRTQVCQLHVSEDRHDVRPRPLLVACPAVLGGRLEHKRAGWSCPGGLSPMFAQWACMSHL